MSTPTFLLELRLSYFLSLHFPFVTFEIYSTIARSLTRSLTFSLGLVVCVIIFIIIQSFSLVVSYKSFVKLMSSFKKGKKKNIKTLSNLGGGGGRFRMLHELFRLSLMKHACVLIRWPLIFWWKKKKTNKKFISSSFFFCCYVIKASDVAISTKRRFIACLFPAYTNYFLFLYLLWACKVKQKIMKLV